MATTTVNLNIPIDTTPTDGSTNLIDSNAVFDGLAGKQDKLYINKITTPSAAVTGTTAETEVYKVTIPANSFASGDKLVIDNFIAAKVGVNGLVTFRFKLSTSATMPAGTTDIIADPQMAITNLSFFAARKFNITGGNITGVNVGVASPQSELLTAFPITTTPFDPTVINYLYVSVILANTSDSVVVHGFTLKNF